MSSSRRVSYFYDLEIGNYHYGQGKLGGSKPSKPYIPMFQTVSHIQL